MRILITGGAGFIGSQVADRFIGEGNGVAIIDNLSSGKREYVNTKAEFFEADIRDMKKLEVIFQKVKPEIVIHAAAQIQVTYSVQHPYEDMEINLGGSINLIQLSVRHKVKKFVFLSTGGALYGNPLYLPADEKHPIAPLSPYGIHKRAVELHLQAAHENDRLNFVCLRFSNVYGIRDSPESRRVIPAFIDSMLRWQQPFITGDGSQGRDFIYVEDVVNAVYLASQKDTASRFLNIGTEKVISINKVFTEVRKRLDSKVKPKYVPERKGEVKSIYLKAELAKKELGWKPAYSFEKGIDKTVAWFRKRRR